MQRRGFIAYDPIETRARFNSDIITAIYYLKLVRYNDILDKDDDGFFTRSSAEIEKATCISRRQQERARKWLEAKKLIHTMVKVPNGQTAPQVHYKILDLNAGK